MINRTYLRRAIFALVPALLLGACASDEDMPVPPIEEEGETSVVPVTVSLETAWQLGDPADDGSGTRTAPPGSGIDGGETWTDGWVNGDADMPTNPGDMKVRLYVFRRQEPVQVGVAVPVINGIYLKNTAGMETPYVRVEDSKNASVNESDKIAGDLMERAGEYWLWKLPEGKNKPARLKFSNGNGAETNFIEYSESAIYECTLSGESLNVTEIGVADGQDKWEHQNDPFMMDINNCAILDVTNKEESSDHDVDKHNHWIAKGKITKKYGYEYKIIAIAYNSARQSSFDGFEPAKNKTKPGWITSGEADWFRINAGSGDINDLSFELTAIGTTSDYFTECEHVGDEVVGVAKRQTLSGYYAEYPQLFWGQVYEEDSTDPIIKYYREESGDEADADGVKGVDTKVPLHGILYRAMAKINLIIEDLDYYDYKNRSTERFNGWRFKWMALMAEKVMKNAKANSYDGFLHTSVNNPIESNDNLYTPIACTQYRNPSSGQVTLSAYMLPCKTKLAMRLSMDHSYTIEELWSSNLINGNANNTILLQPSDLVNMNSGTGIISPDVVGDEFYLRRNHLYNITMATKFHEYYKNHQPK